MKKICKVILAAAAIAALAAPAMAANDKLIVKDAGSGNAFRVQDNGFVESKNTTAADVNVSEVYNNGILRTNLRSVGIQEWQFMLPGGPEVGKIAYSTPGGEVGFGLFHYDTGLGTYTKNKFTMISNKDNGAGLPVFTMNYSDLVTTGNFALTPAGAAFGYTWTPRAQVEINGTLMINDTPADGAGYKTIRPTCSVTYDGGLYYTVGGAGVASKLELCQKAAGGAYAWVLIK